VPIRLAGLAIIVGIALCSGVSNAQEVRVDNTFIPQKGSFRWQVYIDADPSTLARIKCVEYTLVPAFENRVRQVCDPTDGFTLEEAGRQGFPITLTVNWKDGSSTSLSYLLDLTSESRKRNPDPLLRGILPAAITYLPSGMVVLDKAKHQLLQKHQGGFVDYARLNAYASSEFEDATSTVLADGTEFIAVAVAFPSLPQALYAGLNIIGRTQVTKIPPPHWGRVTGIAIDRQEKVLYIGAGPGDFWLYSYRLNGKGQIEPFVSWQLWASHMPSESRLIGPMVVDSSQKLLYAADANNGTLYAVDVRSTHANVTQLHPRDLANQPHDAFGPTTALTLDRDRSRLFIVCEKQVWQLAMASAVPRIVSTWKLPQFRTLSSAEVDPYGDLWLGDATNQCIYIMSPDGGVLRTLKF